MEFVELEASPFKPFQDFIAVKRAKELGFIPISYHEVFADKCACGSERIARLSNADGSVTGITCCDPRCPVKLSYQLALLFERFGYKGLGKETCAKVVQDYIEHGKPFGLSDILLHGEGIISLTGAVGDRWAEGIDKIKTSKQSFGSLLYKWSFPGIGSKFEDIMHGISSMSDLAAAIKEEGFINFFGKRGVKSLTTMWYFKEYLSEIDKLARGFAQCIRKSTQNVLPVCMTGRMRTSVGNFTKDEFIAACTQYLEDRALENPIELKAVETVSGATFVIAGEDSVAGNTAKYRQALAKQDQLRKTKNAPTYKILFSPDEFLTLVLGKE